MVPDLLGCSLVTPHHEVRMAAQILAHAGLWGRGVRLIFTGGHVSLAVAFKRPNVISTL